MIPQTDWLKQPPPTPSLPAFAVPAGLQLLLGIRSDLGPFDLSCWQDRLSVYLWWESPSRIDHPQLEWILSSSDIEFLTKLEVDQLIAGRVTGCSRMLKGNWPTVLDQVPGFTQQSRELLLDEQSFRVAIPAPLQWIWADRPDLQADHDISQTSGRIGLMRWWFKFGHLEYPRVTWRTCPSLRRLTGDGKLQLPLFLSLILQGRDDLQHLDTHSEAGWLSTLIWWEQSGFDEFSVPDWSLRNHFELRSLLAARSQGFDTTRQDPPSAIGLPYLAFQIHNARPDLQSAFPIHTRLGCEQFVAWWKAHGSLEYEGPIALFCSPEDQPPGLNIIGFSQSVIGIAEDVRMAARSAQTADVPFCVIDVPMTGPEKLDHSLDSYTVKSPRHPVSLYCLPPTELIRLGMEGGRSLLLSGTYNIGAWHWELPSWPAHLANVHQMVDEVWVFSEFVRNAFIALGDTPVRRMPLAVELPAIKGADREPFGLPNGPFLYLVMFDGNSWLSRKNPLGAVQAFKAAFPRDRQVGLVIKAINLQGNAAGWQALQEEIGSDDRVFVINETLSRQAVTQLMASCDAYVSLHRSEGFGRIIAEAMLLGIPTVTTNFSGNVDFSTKDTSFLVNGPIVALEKNEYLFSEGQHWCDPDIAQASEQMKRVREDRSERLRVATNARRNITENYSIEAVARAYRLRLQELLHEHRL